MLVQLRNVGSPARVDENGDENGGRVFFPLLVTRYRDRSRHPKWTEKEEKMREKA